MIKALKTVERHAQKHLDQLNQNWEEAGISEGIKNQIVCKIETVLRQIKPVVFQVRERMIGERAVANEKKVLSLYEPDVKIITRNKSGNRVEFGNTLCIVEQKDGLITGHKLYQDQVPSDSKTVLPDMLELHSKFFHGFPMESLTGDRGFDSKRNKIILGEIKYRICPRNVLELEEALQDENFVENQKRRASTEARIHIVKNVFFNKPIRAKGFENRDRRVSWSILTHNLWLLARLPQAQNRQPDILQAA
jgi:hypothetical protein